MKTRNNGKTRLLTGLVAGTLILAVTGTLAKGNTGAKSVDQLTARWWHWQEAYYPASDFGGDHADLGLGQKGEVWYLGGTAGGDPIVRECMDPIPAGKRSFFPLPDISWSDSPGEYLTIAEKAGDQRRHLWCHRAPYTP